MPNRPEIDVFNLHPGIVFPADWLRETLDWVVDNFQQERGTAVPAVLPELEDLEVSLLDDATIAQVHLDFMQVAGATDVITFEHGEILLSLDTAAREAPAHGHTLAQEVLLYAIHGLLHLNGYDDTSEPARTEMHAFQQVVLDAAMARCQA